MFCTWSVKVVRVFTSLFVYLSLFTTDSMIDCVCNDPEIKEGIWWPDLIKSLRIPERL